MNSKTKIAVVGVGHLGQHHARVLSTLDEAELVAIVDLDKARGQKIAKLYDVDFFTDMKDLPTGIEAISIVTPTIHHLQAAQIAFEKKQHVFVEKPIAMNVEEAEQMIKASKKADCFLQVGHIERFNSAVDELKNHLKNPRFIDAHRLGPPTPRVQDIGVVKDLMIHDLDMILWLVDSPIEQIEAVGVPVLTPYEDIANARIKFENGTVANITCSRVSQEQMRRIRFFQENAYLSMDYQTHLLQILEKRSVEGQPVSIHRQDFQMEKGNALERELKAFCLSIQNGNPPLVRGEDGLKALAAAEEISMQILEAKRVSI